MLRQSNPPLTHISRLLRGYKPEEIPPKSTLGFSPGADGIAFDKKEDNLFVDNTGSGRIIKIPFKNDRSAWNATIFAESPLLVGADGMPFDKEDKLYVAVVLEDWLLVVSGKGEVTKLAEGPPLQKPIRSKIWSQQPKGYALHSQLCHTSPFRNYFPKRQDPPC